MFNKKQCMFMGLFIIATSMTMTTQSVLTGYPQHDLNKMKIELQETINKNKKEIENLESKIKYIDIEIEKNNNNIKSNDTDIAHIDNSIKELNTERSGLLSPLSTAGYFQSGKDRLAEIESELKSLESRKVELKAKNDPLNTLIDKFNQEKNTLNDQITLLKNKNEQNQAEINAIRANQGITV